MTTPVIRRRKRPDEVATMQWTGSNEADLIAFTNHHFEAVPPEDRAENPEITAQVYNVLHSTWVGVCTGQHIVRGVKGEYYPIAEDVLAETYDEPTDQTAEERVAIYLASRDWDSATKKETEWSRRTSSFQDAYRVAAREVIALAVPAISSAMTATTTQAALLEVAAQAIRDGNGTPEALEWWRTHPQLIPAHVYAAAVLAVLPPPVNRAAVYAEVADRLAADAEQGAQDGWMRIYKRGAAVKVREWADALAAETAGPETQGAPGQVSLTRNQLATTLAHHADILAARWRAVAPGAGAWEVAAALSLSTHADELTADQETPAVAELLDSILTFRGEQLADAAPADAGRTVAYQSRDGRQLRCPLHAPSANLIGLDWFARTGLDVDGDASNCTETGCGRDVLAEVAPYCSACLLPVGSAPVDRCVVEEPHDEHVTAQGDRWTDDNGTLT